MLNRLLEPHRAKHGAGAAQGRLKTLYLGALAKALRYRKTTCLIGAALLTGSMMLFPLLPTGFLPKGDVGMSQIDVQLPPSATLQQTDAYMQQIQQTLRQYDEVVLVFTTAGSGGEIAKGEIRIRLGTCSTFRCEAGGCRVGMGCKAQDAGNVGYLAKSCNAAARPIPRA